MTVRLRRTGAGVASAALVLAGLAGLGCAGGAPATDIRQWTDDLAFRISVSPMPPDAEVMTTFRVVVQDRKTGKPIETGAGRIFASSQDRAQTYNGLAKGKEPGTYYAQLRFPTSGEWAVGLQFRRDSTAPLERTQDWRQVVNPAPPLGAADTTHR